MSVARGTNKLIGARVRRREDPKFLRGRGNYASDLLKPGMLHVAVFRSDVPHGNIRSINIDAARKIAGVVGVFTADDLAEIVKPIYIDVKMPGYQACEHPVLARQKVCFVGQPIAAVVAETRYEAEDGVDAILADYELLPPVLDIDRASQPGSAAIHESVPDNLFNHFNLVAGDVVGAFANADQVVELEIRNGRCAQVPLETRVIIAEWDELYGRSARLDAGAGANSPYPGGDRQHWSRTRDSGYHQGEQRRLSDLADVGRFGFRPGIGKRNRALRHPKL
jgi:carbon-monoxide dehydrogenase large subunit